MIDAGMGPILISVEYQIDPADREPFLALMQNIGLERRRDGAIQATLCWPIGSSH